MSQAMHKLQMHGSKQRCGLLVGVLCLCWLRCSSRFRWPTGVGICRVVRHAREHVKVEDACGMNTPWDPHFACLQTSSEFKFAIRRGGGRPAKRNGLG